MNKTTTLLVFISVFALLFSACEGDATGQAARLQSKSQELVEPQQPIKDSLPVIEELAIYFEGCQGTPSNYTCPIHHAVRASDDKGLVSMSVRLISPADTREGSTVQLPRNTLNYQGNDTHWVDRQGTYMLTYVFTDTSGQQVEDSASIFVEIPRENQE